MTWSKHGQEYDDECAVACLTDAAYRTHTEAIHWLYNIEEMSLLIPKRLLPRFAGSDDASGAVIQLVGAGFWADRGSDWEVIHHADVIRQSITAQRDKRGRDKRAQAAARRRKVGTNVSADVSADVSASVSADTVSQSGSRTEGSRQAKTGDGFPSNAAAAKPRRKASPSQSRKSAEITTARGKPTPDDQQNPVTRMQDARVTTVTRAGDPADSAALAAAKLALAAAR